MLYYNTRIEDKNRGGDLNLIHNHNKTSTSFEQGRGVGMGMGMGMGIGNDKILKT